jgi:hypothetical protein
VKSMRINQAERVLEPEDLDHLDPGDRHAIRSRADLRRLHWLMGSRGILLRALRRLPRPPRRVLELGAGDGTLMLRVARKLAKKAKMDPAASWTEVRITLLDQHPVVANETLRAYQRAGWHATSLQTDANRFLGTTDEPAADDQGGSESFHLIVANLFLHHFDKDALRAMLSGAARHCDAFIACEPRRSALALFASHLVALAGANAVTRKDAVLSVRAGFRNTELSALWPSGPGWLLSEYPAGLFSHCFVACRDPAANAP